jgi:hypothetical protein
MPASSGLVYHAVLQGHHVLATVVITVQDIDEQDIDEGMQRVWCRRCSLKPSG